MSASLIGRLEHWLGIGFRLNQHVTVKVGGAPSTNRYRGQSPAGAICIFSPPTSPHKKNRCVSSNFGHLQTNRSSWTTVTVSQQQPLHLCINSNRLSRWVSNLQFFRRFITMPRAGWETIQSTISTIFSFDEERVHGRSTGLQTMESRSEELFESFRRWNDHLETVSTFGNFVFPFSRHKTRSTTR